MRGHLAPRLDETNRVEPISPSPYVRFRSPAPNARGVQVGVFALVDGLARAGMLSQEQHELWRRSNDWFEAAYAEPTSADPAVYDRSVNPDPVAWLKLSAVELIEKTTLHTALLDAHQVTWREPRPQTRAELFTRTRFRSLRCLGPTAPDQQGPSRTIFLAGIRDR
jgi:hypothetical protein